MSSRSASRAKRISGDEPGNSDIIRSSLRLHDAARRRAADGREVSLFEVAAKVPLTATAEISTRLHAHPNGVAACEVEIDPETGALEVTRYLSVDDVGRVINPMIVEGQLHGGAAQGIGEALLEEIVYDGDTGQLLTGSFLDYWIPSTMETPWTESRPRCTL